MLKIMKIKHKNKKVSKAEDAEKSMSTAESDEYDQAEYYGNSCYH